MRSKSLSKQSNKHGSGFHRTPRQWENSIATHIGKFVDRMTTSDILNLIIFGAGSYATYRGLEAAKATAEAIPDWLKFLSPLSPFLYQLVIPTETARNMTDVDKIIFSLIGGYSMIKLAPVVVQAIGESGKAVATP